MTCSSASVCLYLCLWVSLCLPGVCTFTLGLIRGLVGPGWTAEVSRPLAVRGQGWARRSGWATEGPGGSPVWDPEEGTLMAFGRVIDRRHVILPQQEALGNFHLGPKKSHCLHTKKSVSHFPEGTIIYFYPGVSLSLYVPFRSSYAGEYQSYASLLLAA